MIKNSFLLYVVCALALGISGCNHNKIPCPTYADSFPEKKGKKVKPGAQKPDIPKTRKARSGVLPGDGKGSRTSLPN